MPADFRTELTLPAETRIRQLVNNFGRSLAVLADFPEDQTELLVQALWEACKNSIEYAYDDDEPGLITLVGELTPKALTLAIRDQGLPFDQTLEPDSPPAVSESFCQPPRRGLGLFLIHQCADEVRWINHGPEGKELRLTKYRRGLCRLEPPTTPPQRALHEESLTKPPQDYTIRLMHSEDAIRVAQLVYRVYGYTYARADVYYPERLAHNIKTGAHVGVVTVAANGEIVGHMGLMRPNLGPLGELGEIAVAPLHRGQGLYKRMNDRLYEEIQRLGLIGFYAEAVTVHTISQEGCEAQGLQPTGIDLLHFRMHFKKLETIQPDLGYQDNKLGQGPQQEALVFYFNYLVPPETTRVCAPARHREILVKIYRNLGVPVKFLKPGRVAGSGRLAVHFNQNINTGFIQANRIGTDTFPEIERACHDLCVLARAAVIFLDLPLAQEGTPDLCDAAEGIGFFFSGVRPYFDADGDCLRLQYLNTTLDPERIHLASPFGRELLDYILREKARVEPNRKQYRPSKGVLEI